MSYLTREEFTHHLFDCIKLCQQLVACRAQYAAAVYKQDHAGIVQRLAEQKALSVALSTQFPALSDEDAAELATRYPWILKSISG